LDVTSQPDSGEATMAEFMLYAVSLIEHICDADRIVKVSLVVFCNGFNTLHKSCALVNVLSKVAAINLVTVLRIQDHVTSPNSIVVRIFTEGFAIVLKRQEGLATVPKPVLESLVTVRPKPVLEGIDKRWDLV
jgi:hypothetical protein